jgi:hypothetical protein
VETRLKGYKYFEIERDFFNKLGVLIDGDFKCGVLFRGGSRGAHPGARPPKIGKNMICWRKIVIFSHEIPQTFSRLPPQLEKI